VASLAAAFPTASDRAQVPVILEIDGRDLVEGMVLNASANIVVYAFDESGVVRDRLYQTVAFDMGRVVDRLRAAGVKYYGTLSLAPGHYAIKTLVRIASSDRRGYARVDITVPRAGELSVVPFVVDEQSSRWLMVKGSSHDGTSSGYPFQVNGEPLVPAAHSRVHVGDSPKLALFVQNALPEELTLDMLPKAAMVTRVKAGDGTKIVLQIDAVTADLNAFDVVVQKQGGEALRVRVPVSVEQ
jgi:hypothetical protein